MSVLLPSTTVSVLSPTTAADPHGHVSAIGWTQRGPFPAHVQISNSADDLTERTRVTSTVDVILDPDAWPLRSEDRLLDADGPIYEVISAVNRKSLGVGADIAHVQVRARLIAEAM